MRCYFKKFFISYFFVLFSFSGFVEASWGSDRDDQEVSSSFMCEKRQREGERDISSSTTKKQKMDPVEEGAIFLEDKNASSSWEQVFDLTPKETATLQILNASLWVSILNPEEVDLEQFSPEKLQAFYAQGGNSPELKRELEIIKKLYPSPVRDLAQFPRSGMQISSPAARHVMTRANITKARKLDFISPLPPLAFVRPFIPETPEEREARKKQELIDYLEVANLRGEISEEQISEVLRQKGGGKSKEVIAAIKREIEIWQDHFNYIATRKERITGGTLELLDEDEFEDEDSFLSLVPEAGSDAEVDILDAQQNEGVKKIRKAEIEDAFENFVADNLIHLDVEGYDLWFSGGIDLDREDQYGETNRERMSRGLCPIGADGETMNFHHLTHYDFKTHKIRSVIVLVTEYAHKTYSGNLHFGRNTYQDLPRKKVNRNEWNKVRMLFNKAIAEYFASLSK